MAAAPPFVSYSSASIVDVPAAAWPDVYASLQALKAHVQEYPGCQRFDVFASVGDSGAQIHCYTTWDSPEQLEVFLERGYTFERMLDDVADLRVARSGVMEKIF
jgi:quinol monooxygenase YgiN